MGKKNEPIVKPEPLVYTEWKCPKCASVNDVSYKFCPKCGCNKDQWKPPKVEQPKNEKKNDIILKLVSVINDGVYSPKEQRNTGWIVANISGNYIDFNAKLMKIGGDSDVITQYEENIEFKMKANEERFIIIGCWFRCQNVRHFGIESCCQSRIWKEKRKED